MRLYKSHSLYYTCKKGERGHDRERNQPTITIYTFGVPLYVLNDEGFDDNACEELIHQGHTALPTITPSLWI